MKQPKITGDTWLNSKPLFPEDLSGKVVLVDFWTYSCVNCQRTLPYLREWWRKYKDKNFLIIGIHTPEFEFEKNPENVKKAIKDLGVEWPVVLDNDYTNWNNFANRYWPAKYLADAKGNIVYTHFGEGNYKETEAAIQALIKSSMGEVAMPKAESVEHAHGNVCFPPTPETYCGYERGNVSNRDGYKYDRVHDYKKPEQIKDGTIGLEKKFLAQREFVEAQEEGATLYLQFHATEVNLVFAAPKGSAIVEVMLNNEPIPEELRGRDVNENGEVEISSSTLYNLLKSDKLIEGILSIRAKKEKFQAYAFTFSGCEG